MSYNDPFDVLRKVIGRRLNELDERYKQAALLHEQKMIDRSRAEIRLIWSRFLTTGTTTRSDRP